MSWTSLGGDPAWPATPITWTYQGASRLDVFIVDRQGALKHRRHLNGQWLPWQSIDGATGFFSAPSIVSERPDRLHVFAKGPGRSMRHVWWDGNGWNTDHTDPAFQDVVWSEQARPVAVSWGQDRIDVFGSGIKPGQGELGVLHWFWQPGSRWRMDNMGRPIAAGGALAHPTIASWAPGRLDLLLYQGSNRLYQRWFDGANWRPAGNPGWQDRGFIGSSATTAVSMRENQLDIFGQGGLLDPGNPRFGYAVHHRWWDGAGWSEESMPLEHGLLSTVRTGTDRFTLLSAHGQEVRHKDWIGGSNGNPRSGQWIPATGWDSFGNAITAGTIQAPPAAVSRAGRLDIFVTAANVSHYSVG